MESQRPEGRSSAAVFPIIITTVVCAFFLLCLVVLTGSFLVPIGFLLILGFGYLHYVLWGRSLTQEIEKEQAVEEARNRFGGPNRAWDDETRIREL